MSAPLKLAVAGIPVRIAFSPSTWHRMIIFQSEYLCSKVIVYGI